MDGRQVLGLINYFILVLILVNGSLALIVKNQRKKLTYLFLMFLCSGIISYLFFSGTAFVIPGMILLFFCVLLFLLVFNQEFFGFGKRRDNAEAGSEKVKGYNAILIPNLVISLLFCLGIGYLLFIYTLGFYQSIEYVKEFTAISMIKIIDNIGSNYIPVLFLFAGILTVSILWFIGILNNRGSEN